LAVQANHEITTSPRLLGAWFEKAIGEKLTGGPLDDPNAGKNPAAVALGKLGAN